MGCNTSQEMKTKDANAALNGEEGGGGGSGSGSGGGGEHTSSAATNGAEQRSGASDGGQTKSANSHTNHSKSNSIISNNFAGISSADEHGKRHASESKQNGVQLSSINGNNSGGSGGSGGGGGGAGSYGYDDDGRACERANIDELNDLELGEDEAKAATKIQAVFRGHKVRNTMKKSETKTTNTTTSNNANNAANALNKNGASAAAAAAAAAAAVAEPEPTKAELEAEFDPNDKELCGAALKIQAAFRGHLTRKLVNKDDEPEDVDIQEITKKVAEELDIDLTDPELNKAATKIQASFRGHKTRKEATSTD